MMPADTVLSLFAPAREPRDVDVAFFTRGDSRDIVPGRGVIRHSDAWRQRARTLATSRAHVHGVETVEDAIDVLEAMPDEQKISRIFFIGHGFDGGFFFSGDPVGIDDFEAPPENVLEDPSPGFIMNAAKHLESLDAETISPELISEFGGQAIALDRPNASISVVTPGQTWRVTGVVGGPTDVEDFFVELAGNILQVYNKPSHEGRTRTRRFLEVLISRLSPTGHVEVNYLSCFTGKPDSQHRLDILTASELQRHGFGDFSVGAYIHYYQVVIEREGRRRRFFDYINNPSSGAVFVPNPGVNEIPPFERLIGGSSISTP